jgi:hypothetical protein
MVGDARRSEVAHPSHHGTSASKRRGRARGPTSPSDNRGHITINRVEFLKGVEPARGRAARGKPERTRARESRANPKPAGLLAFCGRMPSPRCATVCQPCPGCRRCLRRSRASPPHDLVSSLTLDAKMPRPRRSHACPPHDLPSPARPGWPEDALAVDTLSLTPLSLPARPAGALSGGGRTDSQRSHSALTRASRLTIPCLQARPARANGSAREEPDEPKARGIPGFFG